MPVSITEIERYLSPLETIILDLISTRPFCVNFRAFDCRPKSTCLMRDSSVLTIGLNFY